MWCIRRYIFLASVIVFASGMELDSDCPPSSSQTTYSKLKSALLCNYDAYLRPVVNHRNATPLYFKLVVKYFTYDPSLSTLSLETWMRVSWLDEHLTWTPSEHDNLESIYMDTYDIWTPDLSVFNRAVQEGDASTIGTTRCTIKNNGLVLCVPSLHIDSLCVPNLTNYPYDTQTCSVRIGSWVHKGEEIDLKLLKDVVVLSALEPNGEWEIDSYTAKKYAGHYACCPNVTYPSIEIKFKINRLHQAHAASVIIPTLVVVILTFTSLAPSPLNPERLVLCYVNLLIQFMHMQYLSWQVPLKGDQIPLLILYARDSLLMSAFSIVFTIILKYVMQWQTPAPRWISGPLSCILGCLPGRFLFLNDTSIKGGASAKGEEDGINIINPDQKEYSDWTTFARLLDFIYFVAYVIAYFIMTIKFIP